MYLPSAPAAQTKLQERNRFPTVCSRLANSRRSKHEKLETSSKFGCSAATTSRGESCPRQHSL